MQRNRGKQKNGKNQRSLQENWRYQRNTSCIDRVNKGQKWQGPNRSRKDSEEVARLHRQLYNKGLSDLDNHHGVATHLETDILECEVKWALGSFTTNKARRGDGIPAELFQILNDAAAIIYTPIQHSFGVKKKK